MRPWRPAGGPAADRPFSTSELPCPCNVTRPEPLGCNRLQNQSGSHECLKSPLHELRWCNTVTEPICRCVAIMPSLWWRARPPDRLAYAPVLADYDALYERGRMVARSS